jgi:anti-sigma regulatory factor (Ser/Thr protein kinase)
MARNTDGVTVSIARDPALVRTVRLVAAAVARRTGRDEDFVEEVRLAIGEACALMVGESDVVEAAAAHPAATDPVTVSMHIDDQLRVDVVSHTPVDVEDPPHSDIDGVEPWALLRGLIDDFTVVQTADTTTVSMSWPLT